MRKAISVALFVILAAGLSSVAGAQAGKDHSKEHNPTTTRVKTSKEVTPSWTAKGTMYGFVTCDRMRAQGAKVSNDEIKKCVGDGGKYFFGGNNVNTDDKEQAKLAPFIGKYVAVQVTMTSARYGTGPTSDVAVEGLYSGGDRPATRELQYQVVSVAVDPTPDPREGDPQVRRAGRVAAAE
jgi:hypothetical protein